MDLSWIKNPNPDTPEDFFNASAPTAAANSEMV
jgi:hypothetical protein